MKTHFWWFVDSQSIVLSFSWTTASCSSSTASSASMASISKQEKSTELSPKDVMVIIILLEKVKKHQKVCNPQKSEKNWRRSIFRDPELRAC
jgi:hypothetical protein